MVDLTRRENIEVPFQDTGIRGFSADRSAEIAGRAIGRTISEIAPIIEQQRQESFLGAVSTALDDTQLTAGAIEEVGMQAQTELGPEDKNIINQLHKQKRRLDLQVEQGVLSDRAVRSSRLAVAQSAIQANPHLAPEINELFKVRFGRGVGAESLALREESLASITDQKEQFEKGILETSKLFDIPTSLPLDTQLELQRPFVESQLRLNLTKQRNEQASEDVKMNKKLNDDKIAEQLPDTIRVVAGSVRGIIANIDPLTSTDEDKRTALIQLNNLRLSILADAQVQYGRTHTAEELSSKGASVLNLINNRVKWVNGELDKALVESTEAVVTGTAFNKQLQKPGVAELMAKMQALNGVAQLISNIPTLASQFKLQGIAKPGLELTQKITAEGVAEKQTATPPTPTETSGNFFDWMLNTLASITGTDSYSTVTSTAGEIAAVLHMKEVAYAVQANFDNNETVDILLDAMTKYTNGWQSAPEQIPMDVYDAFLDIVADERWIKFRATDASPILPLNLERGLDSATQRMRNSLASDIGQTLRIPLSLREDRGQLLIGEMLTVQIASDGTMNFLPQFDLNKDKNVLRAAAALTKTYGTFFGKLARAYAHDVQGNTDYESAARTLLSTGEFKRAGQLDQEPASVVEEDQGDVQVWIRDANGNLVREGQ